MRGKKKKKNAYVVGCYLTHAAHAGGASGIRDCIRCHEARTIVGDWNFDGFSWPLQRETAVKFGSLSRLLALPLARSPYPSSKPSRGDEATLPSNEQLSPTPRFGCDATRPLILTANEVRSAYCRAIITSHNISQSHRRIGDEGVTNMLRHVVAKFGGEHAPATGITTAFVVHDETLHVLALPVANCRMTRPGAGIIWPAAGEPSGGAMTDVEGARWGRARRFYSSVIGRGQGCMQPSLRTGFSSLAER